MKNNGERHALFEILSACVIALTTVLTAWSAYQSNLWSGAQTFALQEATEQNTIAAEKAVVAQQRQTWDGILVLNFSNAWFEGKTQLADQYRARVRPELREAIDAWLATKPLENPNGPPHPLAMPVYGEKVTARSNSEINEYKQAAQKATDRANKASNISDKYVLMTVLLASVLFFEAVSSRFKAPKVANSLLVFAFLMFTAIACVLVTFPIAHS